MYRKELIDAIRKTGGLPGKGAREEARVSTLLNLSLRQIWGDLPEALLREEWRMKVEPPIKTSTISVDATDPKVFKLDVAPTSPTQIPIDGTARGRWLQITRAGVHYYRRIQDVYIRVIVDAPDELIIVVDLPWDNNVDSGLSYMVYTYQYPYPGDVQTIDRVLWDPDRNGGTALEPMFKESMDFWRDQGSWLTEGSPNRYARGDFFQLPAPHYKPAVATPYLIDPTPAQRWGFDPGGVEHTGATQPSYGPAGTFSYRCIHVWGRWPYDQWSRGDRGSGEAGPLLPFYQSSPSDESDQITATWGTSYINIVSPDIDVDYGYGPNDTLLSHHHHGVEKWWFRARHASEDPLAGTNNAKFPQTQADSVYYLWKITPGHITGVQDRGDVDPVDRLITLKDVSGHTHLMFDRLPTMAGTHVLCQVRRRPPTLQHDFDSPRLPAECYMPLINLTMAYLVGRRDGQPDRESHYWMAYQSELQRLRRLYGTPRHDNRSFSDALTGGYAGSQASFGDVTEIV